MTMRIFQAGLGGARLVRSVGVSAGMSMRLPAFARSSSFFTKGGDQPQPPLVLHGTFTPNNTILTLSRRKYKFDAVPQDPAKLQEYMIDQVRPDQEVIFTVTSGQLGFKGTQKGNYDAAFQTSAKMFKDIKDRKLLGQPIELVTRNFGLNRHAFFATLQGKEGVEVSRYIKRVTDATKIKFGGDRSPNKRRI